MVENLKNNIKTKLEDGNIQCEVCGKRVEKTGKNQKMCRECWKKRERELRKEINKKYYEKNKIKTVFE